MLLSRFFRRKPDDPSNSGALNDLSFLLIVYFIVIAGFNINKGFLLNLPDKEKPRIVQKEEILRVNLAADGSLNRNGAPVTLEALEKDVKSQLAEYPNTTLVLMIHPDTPYQKVVDVIHSVRVLHVENFSFIMEEPAEGS
jgi:biopolymer transport protein ExbD